MANFQIGDRIEWQAGPHTLRGTIVEVTEEAALVQREGGRRVWLLLTALELEGRRIARKAE